MHCRLFRRAAAVLLEMLNPRTYMSFLRMLCRQGGSVQMIPLIGSGTFRRIAPPESLVQAIEVYMDIVSDHVGSSLSQFVDWHGLKLTFYLCPC
jgi:hypothetical protein